MLSPIISRFCAVYCNRSCVAFFNSVVYKISNTITTYHMWCQNLGKTQCYTVAHQCHCHLLCLSHPFSPGHAQMCAYSSVLNSSHQMPKHSTRSMPCACSFILCAFWSFKMFAQFERDIGVPTFEKQFLEFSVLFFWYINAYGFCWGFEKFLRLGFRLVKLSFDLALIYLKHWGLQDYPFLKTAQPNCFTQQQKFWFATEGENHPYGILDYIQLFSHCILWLGSL